MIAALERAAEQVSAAEIPSLVGDLARVQSRLGARLIRETVAGVRPSAADPSDDLRHLTPCQVAALLSLKPAYVHELCRTGRIPATKSGKYWMVPVTGLRRWLVSTNRHVDALGPERLDSPSPRGDTDRSRPPAARSRPPRTAVTTS